MGALQVDLELLGVPCRVLCSEPDLAAEVSRLWRGFVVPPDVVATGASVVDGRAGGAREDLLEGIATALNRAALAGTGLLATHAAAVGLGAATVALPAASGTGKSTLTTALLQLGAGYLSDEALCLDRTDGRVVPYPRPIGLTRWSARELGVDRPVPGRELLLRAEDVGGTTPPVAPPLRHVVVLQRTPGAPGPVLTPAPRSDGVAALLSRSFNHWHDPRSSAAVVAGAVDGAQVWTLQVGRPVETAELVLEALSGA